MLIKSQDYRTENVASRATQGFSKILSRDLVFDQNDQFSNVKDFIKTNMLIKFHDYRPENVASRAYTMFF